MSLDAVLYLLQTYWIFLVLALVIGVATGWYSHDGGDSAKG
ncbi:hypothetical protein [Pelagibacterium montanilacus]|nr:hypothetical protein [Pelagibacterium montanilacus]